MEPPGRKRSASPNTSPSIQTPAQRRDEDAVRHAPPRPPRLMALTQQASRPPSCIHWQLDETKPRRLDAEDEANLRLLALDMDDAQTAPTSPGQQAPKPPSTSARAVHPARVKAPGEKHRAHKELKAFIVQRNLIDHGLMAPPPPRSMASPNAAERRAANNQNLLVAIAERYALLLPDQFAKPSAEDSERLRNCINAIRFSDLQSKAPLERALLPDQLNRIYRLEAVRRIAFRDLSWSATDADAKQLLARGLEAEFVKAESSVRDWQRGLPSANEALAQAQRALRDRVQEAAREDMPKTFGIAPSKGSGNGGGEP